MTITHMDADVDIDVADRELLLPLIKHIPASFDSQGQVRKHNSGVYIQPIPTDPRNNISSILYKEANERGYFKLDILNLSIYNLIKDNQHYEKLMNTPPPWHRLQEREFVSQLIHLGNFVDNVIKTKPVSIPQLAMLLAAVRPAKRHLLHLPWEEIAKEIWEPPKDTTAFYFKKSHSISYAMLVALHMNIIDEQSI